MKELHVKDTLPLSAMTYDLYAQNIKDIGKDSLTITQFDDRLITGSTDLSEDKMLYMSVPDDGGWILNVDGKQQSKLVLNGGMIGTLLKKGKHTVELVYRLRFLKVGLYMCLAGAVLYLSVLFVRIKAATTKQIAA